MTIIDAPWIADDDCETHEWRSAQGETIRFVTRTEAEQRMMPPVTINSIRVPQSQGASFRGARHEPRLATIPVVVPGPQAGRDELRRWAKALDPLKGEGTLTVVVGPWAGRQLVCVYEAGLEDFAEEWPLLGLTVLGFRASDPYWQDSLESSATATIASTGFTWFPFFPLVLGASDVFAQLTINNAGDVDAWPVITVVGPGTDLHLTNLTTGKEMLLTGALAAGSTAVIDTRPGHKTVTIDGVNVFSRLTATSSLWPLVPGPNRVSIGLATGTAASSVRFAWRNRWLAA
jgi:phage-related protein